MASESPATGYPLRYDKTHTETYKIRCVIPPSGGVKDEVRRLLLDINGFRHALLGRLPDQIFVLLGNFVKLDNGQQLIFVVFENFRTKLVAIAVAHALLVDAHFHLSLLLPSSRRVGWC